MSGSFYIAHYKFEMTFKIKQSRRPLSISKFLINNLQQCNANLLLQEKKANHQECLAKLQGGNKFHEKAKLMSYKKIGIFSLHTKTETNNTTCLVSFL